MNNTTLIPVVTTKAQAMSWDDATWILTSSFIIFTMQSGFGLLEAGCVSAKNEVNIMVKNAVDVVFGGITYWAYGYGLSFGDGEYSNAFVGVGQFLVDGDESSDIGQIYSTFIFQLSFATTATTIVSGAMAERTKLTAYVIFSFLNTVVYCIPAHWIWASNGFLKTLGVVDIAGSGGVHLLGAVSAIVAAMLLGPRRGRYDSQNKKQLGNPTNALVGMFMLWWGWLGFNCGSTFGISGGKWILAAKSAVTTINASVGGGVAGLIYSFIVNKKKFMIEDLVNSILGSLVSITASCAIVRPWESIVIGAIGALFVVSFCPLLDRLKIDDPVGAFAVHGIGGIWGMIAVGIFGDDDKIERITDGRSGLTHGGGFYLLGVQVLAIVCIVGWSGSISFILLYLINRTIGLRLSPEEEDLGSDIVEHDINTVSRYLDGCQLQVNEQMTVRRSSFGIIRRHSGMKTPTEVGADNIGFQMQ
ncbi:unnamed protein product [Dimorphilus gyrociliatus]|uniref:Ammonium transporter n=1 Tax=Dimorphilus gyrociliatus TaxID=2664684 RepID=A0A7I8V7W4_9ANNE|nr:unnamed protein product [Dimorphilus gyrociliatus]